MGVSAPSEEFVLNQRTVVAPSPATVAPSNKKVPTPTNPNGLALYPLSAKLGITWNRPT
jgi:hypothetical protein